MKRISIAVLALFFASLSVPAFADPAPPTNLNVLSTSPNDTATGAASATVSWTGSNDAISYSTSATDPGGNVIRGSVSNCQATACSANFSGLTGGLEYDVVVTAVANNGDESQSVAFVFEARSVPFAPEVDEPSLSNGQILLTWTAPDNGGSTLTKYVIRAAGVSVDVLPNQTTYSSSNFTTGQNYTFSIVAVNSLGESESETFTSITYAAAPSTPAAPAATVSGSTLGVTWLAPAANGATITSYTVFLVDSAGNDVDNGVTPNPTNSTSLTLNNVASGTYTLQVRATNAQGSSPRSLSSIPVTVSSGSQSNTPIFSPLSLVAMDIGTDSALSVSAPSGGLVTVAVSATPENACTFSAGRVFAVAAGTCTLQASVPATSSFGAGSASRIITIKNAQTISFAPITEQTLPASVSLAATSTSGLAVRFSAAGSCSVAGVALSLSGAGTCTVTATQPGNNSFSAAQQIVRSFQITPATSQGANPRPGGGATQGAFPRPPSGPAVVTPPRASSATKVNAGSFKGFVALYARGHEGKRFSAKVGKDWVIVPSLRSNFVRIVEFTGVGYRVAVRIFIDRKLEATINLLTK